MKISIRKHPLSGIATVLLVILLVSGSGDSGLVDEAPYPETSRSTEERVEDLISRMTLMVKAAQTAQVARDFLNPASDIRTYGLGSILSCGTTGQNPESGL